MKIILKRENDESQTPIVTIDTKTWTKYKKDDGKLRFYKSYYIIDGGEKYNG